MTPPALFTFGYEGIGIDAFIARLVEAEVQCIADVRELPLSRKKGFSKNAFRAHLAAAGIGYEHLPALGCPKPIRNAYREHRDWTAYTSAFLAHLRSVQREVKQLAALAREQTTCLVCFEADHHFCHRTYVARAVRSLGGPAVQHLGARTALADAPMSLAA